MVVVANALASVTLAQHNQVSLFFTQAPTSVRARGGYGAAFHHAWTPRFSSGIAVAVEDPVVAVCVGGIFTPQRCTEVSLRTHPVDLLGRFHFLNDTRWKPHMGLGVRYVAAPHLTPDELLVIGHTYSDHLDVELVGGLEFLITPSFGISAEMKSLMRNRESYNPFWKVAGGVNWRF